MKEEKLLAKWGSNIEYILKAGEQGHYPKRDRRRHIEGALASFKYELWKLFIKTYTK